MSGMTKTLLIAAAVVILAGGGLLAWGPWRGAAAPEPPDPAPGPNGAAASQEIGERVARAVGTLPASQREVVVLKLYDELTYSEIAEALGRPLGTVKTQMRAALKALRPRLRAIAEAHGLT